MNAVLRIRNFGPIKDIDIEISKFNILIGPHAAGKSTISKVLCIMHMFDVGGLTNTETKKVSVLEPLLVYFKVENFYKNNTYWYFKDDIFTFELQEGEFNIAYDRNDELPSNTNSYYFPAERIALPMISESLFELNLNDSSLPKYFLKFGRDFVISRKNQKIFNLPLLGVEFEYSEGKNKVKLRNNQSLLLDEASSAIQANLPLLVILQYPVEQPSSLFVIEELELHSFPELQKKLFYYLVERMRHPKLAPAYVMLPTHSPYLLSVANNLLFAAKAGKVNSEETNKIIPQKYWIEKTHLSAYFIENGGAVSIIDKQTGLIHENMLDSISEGLAENFDALVNVYKPETV